MTQPVRARRALERMTMDYPVELDREPVPDSRRDGGRDDRRGRDG